MMEKQVTLHLNIGDYYVYYAFLGDAQFFEDMISDPNTGDIKPLSEAIFKTAEEAYNFATMLNEQGISTIVFTKVNFDYLAQLEEDRKNEC